LASGPDVSGLQARHSRFPPRQIADISYIIGNVIPFEVAENIHVNRKSSIINHK